MLTVCILLLPHIVNHLICRESYRNWVLRKNSSVHSVTVTWSCDILVLMASSSSLSSSSSATLSPFFFLPWERVSWAFLGCHYASFLIRSLGFLELFSNSTLSAFGHLSRGLASCLAITRTIWSEWTRAWWSPFELALFLSSFGCLSWGPAFCLTVPRTIWSEWTRSVPLGLQ